MRWILPLFMVALPVCTGCGKDSRDAARFANVKEKAAMPGAVDFKDNAKKDGAPGGKDGGEFVAHQDGEKGQPAKKAKDQPRKIRYTSDMKLIVEDFVKAEKDLDAVIEESKGKLASSESSVATNSIRSGTWRIRVPVENFQSFRLAVAQIGEVERNTVDSEDMTDKYYDLDAHIKNRLTEREAIRELLKEIGKKDLKHYIEVKRELDSISDDINRKEGMLRLWANQTDLTTCSVHLREKQKFIAEKKVEEKEIPTFGMRAGKTWNESWDNLLGFSQTLLIIAIAIIPWLPIPLIFFGVVFLVVRRLARSTEAPIVLTVVEEPKEGEK